MTQTGRATREVGRGTGREGKRKGKVEMERKAITPFSLPFIHHRTETHV